MLLFNRKLSLPRAVLLMSGCIMLVSCAICSIITGNKVSALITGFDTLCMPGETVELDAKLETDDAFGTREDIPSETLVFSLGNRQIGTAVTDNDGHARLSFNVPSQEGDYAITVSLSGQSKYAKTRGGGILLAVRNPETEFIISDIDHTLADASALEFLMYTNANIRPLEGSVDTMNLLANRYSIIYLTHRDDRFLLRTKEWLELKGFPQGISIFSDWPHTPLNAAKFKSPVIKQLKAKWRNIKYGFGDKETDFKAYSDNGIECFIITPDNAGQAADNAHYVKNWQEIKTSIEKNEK